MKQTLKRLAAILIVLALVLGVAACGDGGSTTSSEPEVTSSDAVGTESEAAESDTVSEDASEPEDTPSENATETVTSATTAQTSSKKNDTSSSKPSGSTQSSAPKYKTFTNEAGTVMAKIDNVKGEKITLLCVDYAQFDPDGSANTYLKKYYGISVEQKRMPNDNIATEFTTAYLSGHPYDLVTDTNIFPQYVTQNVIEPLTNRIDFSIPELAKNKPMFDAYVYGGDNYFLPWTSSAMALIYFNVEVFEDANLDLNGDGKKGDTPYTLFKSGDWTWENFKKAAKLTNRTNKNGETMVYGLLARAWTDARIVYISGQTLTKVSGGKPVSNLDNSDFQRIYNDYVTLINNDKVVKRGDDAIYNTFNNGGGAMLLGPGYMTKGDYFPTIFADQNVGIAPIPRDEKSGTYYVPGEGYGFWVSKNGFYRNGKFNVDLLNAFINGTVISQSDQGKKGTEAYNTARSNFVTKWSKQNRKFTDSWYDKYHDVQEEFSKNTTALVDPYGTCMNISQVLDVMTGWGDQPPGTFSAAVNMFEGQLQQQLDELEG